MNSFAVVVMTLKTESFQREFVKDLVLTGSVENMTRKRFRQEQIMFALRQAKSGLPVKDVCRKLGICQATFFQWKTK
jgi:putative transposase